MATRPTFGHWLKVTWLDILTMIIMGAVGLGVSDAWSFKQSRPVILTPYLVFFALQVYMAHPAPSRSFAVTFSDGEVVYPEFAYPMRKEIVPIWLAAFLATVIPIVVILAMQVRIRSFWDANNAIVGLLYGVIAAAVFQVFIKWLIGGLRPHFLTVCRPDVSLASADPGITDGGYNAKGFNQIYYTREICTGDRDEIDDSLESMPSGHATAAFAGFVYLYLYLNAKLKVFANYHPAMWKLVAIYAPLLGACLIGGALTIDEFHNWYDIVAGAVIGTVMAFSAYRMCYAAIWDWRINHVPLSRVAPIAFAGDHELAGATFTRRAGWGIGGAAAAETGLGGNGVAPVGGVAGNGAGGLGYPHRKPVASGMRRGDEMV